MRLQIWLSAVLVIAGTANFVFAANDSPRPVPVRTSAHSGRGQIPSIGVPTNGGGRPQSGVVRGRVVDGRTKAPVEQVLVTIDDAQRSATTNRDGEFELAGLSAGPHRLVVSVVGYTLVRRDVIVSGEPAVLVIELAEGTTAFAETVTVTPSPFRTPTDIVPSAQILGAAELMNLRGVLADDPLRAVQALPGVATGDDFKSEFTVRGSDFSHIAFTLDGFDTPYLLHSVRGVDDRGPTGSVAMINSDVLEDVTLLNGGYPQRYGGHTGAEVDFRMREGARDRAKVTASVSGTAASAVAEGPIGSRGRGSWLVSGRQSYLDLVVHHLTSQSVAFGFSDGQAKLTWDLTPAQRLATTVVAGRSRFENDPDLNAIDDVAEGFNRSAVDVTSWRWIGRRATVTQRVLIASNGFHNESPTGVELDRGTDTELGYRVDATRQYGSASLDAGAAIERRDNSRIRVRLAPNRVTLQKLDDYTGDALRRGGYVSARWTPFTRLVVSPGVRLDASTLDSQSAASPWVQVEAPVLGGTLRAASGEYEQFADFFQVLGVSGNSGLRPERAIHLDVGFERRLGASTRVSITAYGRNEDEVIRRPGAETRVVGARVVRGVASTQYENRLDGRSRGVELSLQRTVTSGLTGWVSYSYARTRYTDVVTAESFWGDADQRHTLNLYGAYRHSTRASFVAKLRVGSNFPITGYIGEQNDTYFVTDVRNTARLPTYARLDLRANRTFNLRARRVTLFAEVLNVLDRANVRYTPPAINTVTRATTRPFDTMLPIVPSLGVLIEF